MIKTIPLLTLCILFLGCTSHKKVAEIYQQEYTPAGTVKIKNNFYYDGAEMTNVDWREYLYWTRRVYGKKSPESFAALPDTNVWNKVDYCFYELIENYIKHPAYSYHPLVGINQKQALEYSKWRSDRVFESLLIELKQIRIDTAATRETHFTIERYFNNDLSTYLTDQRLYYYPEYRLPTLEERKFIINYTDSINVSYLKNCKTKKCKEYLSSYPQIHSNIDSCIQSAWGVEATQESYKGNALKKFYPIYNLRGNVAEWMLEDNLAAGGGWKDSRDTILKSDIIEVNGVNAWTGFRNVCEWKKWMGNTEAQLEHEKP